MRIKKGFKYLSVFTAAMLLFAAVGLPHASAGERELRNPTVGNTFIDAIAYRPVGLVSIPVGAVLFVLTLPFSAIGGNVGTSFDNLVVTPARFTFVRPLGDI
jgi:hypothetical protein